MARMIRKVKSQAGFIVTIELLVLAAVLVLGLIVGMVSLRDSVLAELADLSESIGNLNQGYMILGVQNVAGTAATAGSSYEDNFDNTSFGSIDSDPADPGDADGDLDFLTALAIDEDTTATTQT